MNGSMIHQYRELHKQKNYGCGGFTSKDSALITRLMGNFAPESVIDYGCGQSVTAAETFRWAAVKFYDPAIPSLDILPDRKFDLGCCTDVLEHVPEAELPEVFAEMRTLTGKWLMIIHTGKAAQILPNGENAHCTVRPVFWWQERIDAAFGVKSLVARLDGVRFYLTTC